MDIHQEMDIHQQLANHKQRFIKTSQRYGRSQMLNFVIQAKFDEVAHKLMENVTEIDDTEALYNLGRQVIATETLDELIAVVNNFDWCKSDTSTTQEDDT